MIAAIEGLTFILRLGLFFLMFITVCIKEDYLSYFDGIRMSDIAPSSFSSPGKTFATTK